MKLPFPLPKWRTEEDEFPSLWRGAVSEFFACLIFIFVGCGSVVASNETLGSSTVPVDSVIAIALAHGFCIMVLVYSIGEVSGGHINPAVTWACLMTDKISVLRAFVYWISQLTGAVLGAAFLLSILPPASRYNLGCHGLNPHLTPAQGFGAETIFSFIFIFVVFATAISPFAGKFAPLAGGSGDYGPGKRCEHESCSKFWSCHCSWLLGQSLDLLDWSTSRQYDCRYSCTSDLLKSTGDLCKDSNCFTSTSSIPGW